MRDLAPTAKTLRIASTLAEASGEIAAPRASLWATDLQSGHNCLVAAVGQSDNEPNPLGLTIARGNGLVGLVAQSQSNHVVTDVAASRDHLSVSSITQFQPGAIISEPVIIRGETWGVLQVLNDSKRNWNAFELIAARYYASQLSLKLAEQFVPSIGLMPDSPLAKVVCNNGDHLMRRSINGTLLCLDVVNSTGFLQQVRKEERTPLEIIGRYFEAAVKTGAAFGGEAIASPGDAIVILFQGLQEREREQRALGCVTAIKECFAKIRRDDCRSSAALNFHCAVTSGDIEVGQLINKSGVIQCALGNAIHQAFGLTKAPASTAGIMTI